MFVTLKCRVFEDDTGRFTEIPAILTPAGWFQPLVDYCLFHRINRSPNWMVKVNRSMRLFLSYMVANPSQRDSYQLFQNFAQRLYSGTFDLETGLDPSWLCWRPVSTFEARKIIGHVTAFFDWLNEKRPGTAVVNPVYEGNAYDRLADEAAFQFRRSQAFLGHTWRAHYHSGGSDQSNRAHLLRARRPPKIQNSNPPAFPEDRFMDLITEGFIVGGEPNYRDILITLLLHGAGFRYSEPFHLYVTDVFRDPGNPKEARVHIHHPSDGFAPKDPTWLDARNNPKKGTRSAYLAERFGLAPRHLLLNTHSAGWKNPLLDEEWYMRAYWFLPRFGELFLTFWYRYLEQIAHYDRPHPYAWINFRQGVKGEMYGMSQYSRAHARACERIGLEVGKELGTTPHGHRHAYGRRLVAGGFTPEFIRKFMHHHSLDSQRVYTTPTPQNVIDALAEGAERLLNKNPGKL